ncbi:MAG: carboxyl transferase domain-containing protein, partial [Solirubrobacteraceae bacterium]
MTTLAVAARPDERFTALERLETFYDHGSIHLLRTQARSRRMGDRAVDGDGVLAAVGMVDGRQVVSYAQDGTFLGGSLGQTHADTVVEAIRVAERARVPLVGFVESGGARLQEGLDSLDGYARIFAGHVRLSGVVPQISVVCGAAAGGGAYGPALTDFVVLAPRAAMFLTGPSVVREVLGEDVTASELGGPSVHRANGVAHLDAPTEIDAILTTRTLLDHLPQRAGEAARVATPMRAGSESPGAAVPDDPRKVYDVRHVVGGLLDGGRLLEISPSWAPNVVCGLGRLEGRPVGVVANQPNWLSGVLDADAGQKAARFVRSCDLFGIPLIVLVDTPGFLPGSDQERGAVIRHGAKLVHAFADASVPRVTVVLRKAFGGALIAMNSKGLGADGVFAWPRAQLGVMGAPQAVGIIERRAIAAADDPAAHRTVLADAYAAEHLGAAKAATDGHIDDVVLPGDTRRRIAAIFDLLQTRD